MLVAVCVCVCVKERVSKETKSQSLEFIMTLRMFIAGGSIRSGILRGFD